MTQAACQARGLKLSTMLRFALLLLAMAAPLAQAQTYKWVDERGVVNYSNTPPPNAAKAQPVEDRISIYASDPVTVQAGAVDRRLAALDAEWLQRQQLMAYAAAAAPQAPAYDEYRMASYYAPYILPAVAHRRPMFFHPTPVRPAVRTQRASVRLDLRR
jgi:hypothetical protein